MLQLHEIELFSADPSNTGDFYQNTLGLTTKVDLPELKVLDAGIPDFDFNVSAHNPDYKVSLSFLVEDLAKVHAQLSKKGVVVSPICDSHLEMKGFYFIVDGIRIMIHSRSA